MSGQGCSQGLRLPEPSLTKKLPSGPTAIIRSDIGSDLVGILKQGLERGVEGN